MKNRFWAVFIKVEPKYENRYRGGEFCFTWDKKHTENTRKEKTVRVWAIYPRKKDALNDAKFRGESYVKEVFILAIR